MHEAVKLSVARDILSWVVFLAVGISLVGLVALESSQVLGGHQANPLVAIVTSTDLS